MFRLKFILIIFSSFIFMIDVAFASPGSEHAADMMKVLFGERVSCPSVDAALREFSKTIDNFEVIKGLPVGRAGHRVYGHWGFASSIPFEYGELKLLLERIAAAEGEPARKIAMDKIRAAWQRDVRRLIKISEQLLGMKGRAARGLAGILYDVHLLGDWQGVKLASLQDVDAIVNDLEKNIHRLFGNNSKAAKEFIPHLRNSYTIANSACGGLPACIAKNVIVELKKSNLLKNSLSNMLRYKAANSGLLYNPVLVEMRGNRANIDNYKSILANKYQYSSAHVGLLLPDGRLIVAVESGAAAGLFVFAVDGGVASYNYFKGNCFWPEYKMKLITSALNGAAVGGATAVAVILGINPAGVAILGIGAGAYFVMDTVQQIWIQRQEAKYLSAGDLQNFGILIDSPLDFHIDRSIPLNVEDWE